MSRIIGSSYASRVTYLERGEGKEAPKQLAIGEAGFCCGLVSQNAEWPVAGTRNFAAKFRDWKPMSSATSAFMSGLL